MFKLLDGVICVRSNRYCICALNDKGEVWVTGKDSLGIGILGLGPGRTQTRDFERIHIPGPVRTVCLADCYGVALSMGNEFFIWGTSLDHFFGEICIIKRA